MEGAAVAEVAEVAEVENEPSERNGPAESVASSEDLQRAPEKQPRPVTSSRLARPMWQFVAALLMLVADISNRLLARPQPGESGEQRSGQFRRGHAGQFREPPAPASVTRGG